MSIKNLLGIKDIAITEIEEIIQTAASSKEVLSREIKKVPTLRGKNITLLFYEPSTRTRLSFENAGKILSCDVSNIAPSTSSIVKGESLKDTVRTIQALKTDLLVIRHSAVGAAHLAARYVKFPVVNAGDGINEHPTQALLDLYTIMEKKKLKLEEIKKLKIAIVGDILHSRVARSNIWALTKLGSEVRLCGPPTMIPKGMEKLPVKIFYYLEKAIEKVDVIMMLRLQLERQSAGLFPHILEYAKFFGLNKERLKYAKEDVLVMHPGPISRGVEISDEVADGLQSAIDEQVTNGIAVRMAIIYLLCGSPRLEINF